MLCSSSFELYSRWVPLDHLKCFFPPLKIVFQLTSRSLEVGARRCVWIPDKTLFLVYYTLRKND